MRAQTAFFICPKCFKVSEECEDCHETEMILCNTSKLTDEQLKPLYDADGNLATRAPRWFLEAMGVILPLDG